MRADAGSVLNPAASRVPTTATTNPDISNGILMPSLPLQRTCRQRQYQRASIIVKPSAWSAWPADINNDGFSDISDISFLTADFGNSVPPALARHNVAPDPPDGFIDITDIARIAGLFGLSCL